MRCYCASTRQVARRLTRFYEAELRPAGVNPAQFELLATLSHLTRTSQSELATAMDVDQTTLSRSLKLMIGQGWVLGSASTTDARRMEYELTREGRRTLKLAMPCWQRAMVRLEEGLGPGASGVWAVLDGLNGAAKG